MALIIFTGLDGILLPIEENDCEPVAITVKQLQQQHIPLVPVTNNTRAEVEALFQKIAFNAPFVVEGGSGIFIPQDNQQFKISDTDTIDNYHIYQLGCTYTEARAALKVVQEEISKILRGFGDLDEANIQTMMGVSSAAARRAKSREFSEYFLTPSRLEISKLQTVAQEYGFQIVTEGKLSLVMGGGASPAKAVSWLKENYQTSQPEKLVTVGIGSTEKDLPMLEAVDIPIVVPTSGEINPNLASKNWEVATVRGSLGWINAIAKVCQGQIN